jgi:hypothetical protein
VTDRLSLYNGALREIGERQLASLSENRESRRVLDGVWNNGAAVKFCLEKGQWNFAARTVRLDYSPSVEPEFGYRRAFVKPTDWVRTMALASDDRLSNPIIQYEDGNNFWWADEDQIYVRYVSNDASYGLDYSLWPETFVKFVETYIANEIVWPLTQNRQKKEVLERDWRLALRQARSSDAMNQPTQFPPPGRLIRARRGSGGMAPSHRRS